MAAFEFELANAAHTVVLDSCFSTEKQALILRKKNAVSGLYDPTGLYPVSAQVTTDAMALVGYKELFAFEIDSEFDTDSVGTELGAVKARISLDGTNYYYWTGMAWAVASTSSHYSTPADIDANCLTLPLPDAGASFSIKVQLKLESDSTRKHTPRVYAVKLGVELYVRPFEDATRSVIRHLRGFTGTFVGKWVCAAGTTHATSSFTALTPLTVVRAFDLTADPGRVSALSASFSGANIVFSPALTVGHVIEVEFTGRCSVTPMAEDELVDGALPNVALMPLRAVRDDQFGNWREIIISRGRGKARSRIPPEVFIQRFRLYCVADRNEDAFQIADGITRKIEETIPYIPTGEQMTLVSLDHLSSLDFEPRGMYSKQVEFVLQFRRYQAGYVEDALLTGIHVHSTDIESENLTGSVDIED